jgi:multidrug resistance efflux pump
MTHSRNTTPFITNTIAIIPGFLASPVICVIDVEFFQKRLKEVVQEHKSRITTADLQLEEAENEKKLEVEQAHHREVQMRARLAVVQQQLEEARTACNDLQGQCEELKATQQNHMKLRLEQFELRHREIIAGNHALHLLTLFGLGD